VSDWAAACYASTAPFTRPYDDPGILETQGRSSRLVARLLTDYSKRQPEFATLLSDGAKFLDVGSGVGWISLTIAHEWPMLRAVGIDILEPALELAAKNLANTKLSDRVMFRKENVLDLEETEAFDVIFVPVIFLPEAIIDATFFNLRRALKPGGWLFAAAYRVPEDTKLAVLNDLRTTLSGGRAWTDIELEAIANDANLTSIGDIATGSPLHVWASRRKS